MKEGSAGAVIKAETCGPCHSDANCIHSAAKPDGIRGILKDVRGYKNAEVVLRIREKAGCTEQEAEALFDEMKQFLANAATSRSKKAPSRSVDVAWHEFILFTRDYAEFCQEYFGRFMHHVPTPRLKPATVTAGCNTETGGCNCSPNTGGGGNECSPEHD